MSGSERASAGDDRVDPRPLALAASAWAGMWLAASLDPICYAVGAAAASGSLVVAWRRRSLLALAIGLVMAGCLLSGGVRWWFQGQSPVRELAGQRAIGTLVVRTTGTPRFLAERGVQPAVWVSRATLLKVDARGSQWNSGATIDTMATGQAAHRWRRLVPGTTVRFVGRLEPADPGEAQALARAREPPVVVSDPGPVDAAVEAIHRGLGAAVRDLPTEPRALVPALVMGDTSAMSPELTQQFKATGLTHLTAVSGANLTLLLVFVGAVAVRLGARGWGHRIVLTVTVGSFVLLCRGEPSVVRAGAMGVVGLVALGWAGRGRAGLRHLAAAVFLVVFIDPWLARSVGFALSVLASAGIVLWAADWGDRLARWLPGWLAEAVSVPLAAQIATQPLVTAISGQVSLAGLVANVLAGPLVGPATVTGFIAAGLSLVWLPGARAFGWLSGLCAQGLCWIASWGDGLPGATSNWPVSPAGLGLVVVGSAVTVALIPWLLARRWAVVMLALAMTVGLLRPIGPVGWPPPGWVVVFCDVGQGDATVVRAGPEDAVLIDAGPDPRRLRRCLAELGINRLALVMLTHLHADHITGLTGLRQSVGVAHLVTGPTQSPPYGVALLDRELKGVPRTVARTGDVFRVGDVQIETISLSQLTTEPRAGEGESAAENDASVVVKIRVGGLTVLVAGDVETGGQSAALASGRDLRADVVLVPHHGSSRQDDRFLTAVRPQVAVFSVGADNDYGHPSLRTLRLVQATGASTARTDEDGGIGVGIVGDQIQVTTQRA